MNCNDLQQQLETAVENRESLALEHWREHLEDCEECRRLCADYQLLERAVTEWSGIDESPDFSDQILAILDDDPDLPQVIPKQTSKGGGIFPLILALAAAVLIVIGFRAHEIPDEPTSLVNVILPEGESSPGSLEEPGVDMDQILLDTRNAYASLLGRAQSSMTPLRTAVSTHELKSSLVDKPQKASPNTSNPEPLLSEELKPLQTELTQSFGFLTAFIPEPGT